jgi:hypothetical protein
MGGAVGFKLPTALLYNGLKFLSKRPIKKDERHKCLIMRHGGGIEPGYGGTRYENTELRHTAKRYAQAGEEQGCSGEDVSLGG